MPDVIEVLADLVSIPSVNPMGSPARGPEFGEARVAAYVEQFLDRHGIRCHRQTVMPGRENVLAHVSGRGSRSVLLETHMDTVSADNMEIAPFEPVERDGKLFGRGTCDAKASLAAMLTAMVQARRSTPATDLWLCAVVDEEHTFGGAAYLVRSGFRADYVLVGEPTRLQVVTAHKGAIRWRITAHGRAAHSATPWKGDNAIYRMAKVVKSLERYAEILMKKPPHPRLGPRTLNVGTIQGGQTVNTVPDCCTITVDRRVLPGETLEEVGSSLPELLTQKGLMEGLEIVEYLRDAPMEIGEDHPWVRAVLAAARAFGEVNTVAVHYSTDASKFAQARMPAVVMGPGDIAQAHTTCEWVDVEQVRTAAAVYARITDELAHLGAGD